MKAADTSNVPADLRLAAKLLALIDSGTLVADRSGRVLFVDGALRRLLALPEGLKHPPEFIGELLDTRLEGVLSAIENGSPEVAVQLRGGEGEIPAQVRWLRQPDWLIFTVRGGCGDGAGELFQPPRESAPSISSSEVARRNGNGSEADAEEPGEICKDWISEDLVFLSASPEMAKIRRQILHVAGVNVPVLIWGESGTGKEVLARMVHTYSKRRDRPFIKVNCAALPSELLESELFGYEQGAFTGAVRPKPGKFEFANHGTIFLDEVAEMSSHLQSKLLHVLQDKQFTRLGGRSPVHVDARVIAATNVEVHEAIEQGALREDLYYRLSVVAINVPPLRQRRADIPLLFRHALAKYQAEFGQEIVEPPVSLIDLVLEYEWPGNVRELENFAKRHVILGDAEESMRELQKVTAEHHQAGESGVNGTGPGMLKTLVRNLKDEAEARAIAEALKQTRWCRKDAARMLGISYKALLYKIRQLGLAPATWKEDTNGFRRDSAPKITQ